jgi:hypothetical protein
MGWMLGEVETASFHLAQDTAADIVVQAAHETSSCNAMDRLSVHYAPAGIGRAVRADARRE